MNTTEQINDRLADSREALEDTVSRAAAAVRRNADTISEWISLGALGASVVGGIDAMLRSGGRKDTDDPWSEIVHVARKHPAVAATVGAGGLAALWIASRQRAHEGGAESALREGSEQLGSLATKAQRKAEQGAKSALSAGRSMRATLQSAAETLGRNGREKAEDLADAARTGAGALESTCRKTLESVSADTERLVDGARQLRHSAEEQLRNARDFARKEPALAVAGGAAFAVGTFLLVRYLKGQSDS